jgi:alpha-tubulin suppressor-like RCC1 family protein
MKSTPLRPTAPLHLGRSAFVLAFLASAPCGSLFWHEAFATAGISKNQYPQALAADHLFSSGFETYPLSISAGYYSVCALMSDSTIRCWGDNSGGQLGNSTEGNVPIGHALPVLDGGLPLTGAVRIAVGNWHACAVMANGGVKCWGSNFSGQLGLGNVEPSAIHGPTDVLGLATLPGEQVVELAVGKEHSCALLSSTVVKCWGLNQVEQAGQNNPAAPNMMYVSTPTEVDLGGAAPAHIFAGAYHSCVLTSGETTCWGVDADGEIGRTRPANTLWDMPGPSVPEIVNPTVLTSAASAEHVCATMPDLTHQCWGRFESGQLGDGTFDSSSFDEGRPTASTVLDDPGFESLNVGALNSCGILNGAVSCWGNNTYGQLTVTEGVPEFSAVPFVTSISGGATQVAVGVGVVCAIVANRVECWGVNDNGVLGRDLRCGFDPDPDACTSPTPQLVHGF